MTVVPFAILVAMAVPASLALIDMYDAGGEDLSIEVHAHRWKWEYIYLDEDHNQTLRYFSNLATPAQQIANVSAKSENYLLEVDEPLVIPVNRKVRFRITSKDVIHAFWVPDFGIKQDAVPGIFNDLWTIVDATGVYRGQCAELCGKDHAFMPVVVRVVSQVEYEDWYERRLLQFLDRQALGNEVAPGDVTRALEVSKALVR